MSRLQDAKGALSDGRRRFERIMKRKRYTPFYTNEVYAPGSDTSFVDAAPQNVIASCDNLEYMEYLLKEKNMAGKVHEACGAEFLTVTPGVRFAEGPQGDQKRVTTPARAKELGSDYIVVGRPITRAEDPVAAYLKCVEEFID